MNDSETPKRSGGLNCFVYGCLGLLVVAVIGILVAVYGAKYAFNRVLDAYTDTQPAELPAVELAEGKVGEVEERFEVFKQAFEAGEQAALELTAEDINALIASEPELANKVRISIEGDEIKAQVSIPLDKLLADLGIKGRYLNGAASVQVAMKDGVLEAYIQSLEVKGKPLPEQFMAELRKENIAKDMNQDPEAAEKLERFDSLEVKDGKLILRAKQKGAAPVPAEPTAAPDPAEPAPAPREPATTPAPTTEAPTPTE